MQKKLRLAAYAMVVQLLLVIPAIYFEVLRTKQGLVGTAQILYVVANIGSIITYCIGMYGFVLIGKKYKNRLMEYSAFSFMGIAIVSTVYNVILSNVQYDPNNLGRALLAAFILFLSGLPGIPFGISLFQLKTRLGGKAEGAGVLSVLISASLLTIILGILGFLLMIPWIILLIVILLQESKKAPHGGA